MDNYRKCNLDVYCNDFMYNKVSRPFCYENCILQEILGNEFLRFIITKKFIRINGIK